MECQCDAAINFAFERKIYSISICICTECGMLILQLQIDGNKNKSGSIDI